MWKIFTLFNDEGDNDRDDDADAAADDDIDDDDDDDDDDSMLSYVVKALERWEYISKKSCIELHFTMHLFALPMQTGPIIR